MKRLIENHLISKGEITKVSCNGVKKWVSQKDVYYIKVLTIK